MEDVVESRIVRLELEFQYKQGQQSISERFSKGLVLKTPEVSYAKVVYRIKD